jgi:hypothetical protein
MPDYIHANTVASILLLCAASEFMLVEAGHVQSVPHVRPMGAWSRKFI